MLYIASKIKNYEKTGYKNQIYIWIGDTTKEFLYQKYSFEYSEVN